MPVDQITLRLHPAIRAALAGLVERGAYRSITEFAVEAILLKLDLEGVPVEEGLAPPDPIAASFESPRGQAVLCTVVGRELAAMQERGER